MLRCLSCLRLALLDPAAPPLPPLPPSSAITVDAAVDRHGRVEGEDPEGSTAGRALVPPVPLVPEVPPWPPPPPLPACPARACPWRSDQHAGAAEATAGPAATTGAVGAIGPRTPGRADVTREGDARTGGQVRRSARAPGAGGAVDARADLRRAVGAGDTLTAVRRPSRAAAATANVPADERVAAGAAVLEVTTVAAVGAGAEAERPTLCSQLRTVATGTARRARRAAGAGRAVAAVERRATERTFCNVTPAPSIAQAVDAAGRLRSHRDPQRQPAQRDAGAPSAKCGLLTTLDHGVRVGLACAVKAAFQPPVITMLSTSARPLFPRRRSPGPR